MEQAEIDFNERVNTGTSWTRNQDFDRNGYLIVRDLCDPQELYREVPEIRGQINYWGKKEDEFHYSPEEAQVNGSLAVYSHPQYRQVHSKVRVKLEKIIGRKLYDTYYYDRFYFAGQDLKNHTDRSACEISVSIHISSNTDKPWPLWIKTPYGEKRSGELRPGDGMVYKGCERPHWRNPLPGKENNLSWLDKIRKKEFIDDTYYHQVFFHYVLQDGLRAHCAWDKSS